MLLARLESHIHLNQAPEGIHETFGMLFVKQELGWLPLEEHAAGVSSENVGFCARLDWISSLVSRIELKKLDNFVDFISQM